MTGHADDLASSLASLDADVRDMLREDLPAQRDAAIAAIEAGNFSKARDIVHTVNGSASFCRLHELQSAATALESDLDQQRDNAVSRDAFFVALEATLDALRQRQ